MIVWWTVPISRVVIGIVGDSPQCTDGPQALKSSYTHWASHNKFEKKVFTFPVANLASAAILSPIAGRRALYRKGMINMFESRHRRFTSQKLLRVPARVFSGGSALLSCTNMIGLRTEVILYSKEVKGTWNRGCRRDRRSASPSPSWRAAAPPETSPSMPWSKHNLSATALHICSF